MPRKRRQNRSAASREDEESTAVRIGDLLAYGTGALDRRTAAYRAFASVRDAIVADCGGASLSEVKRQLIDRFALLALWSQTQDARALAGEKINADTYGRISGHMKRLADAIGTDRVMKTLPDVETYLRENYGATPD